MHDVIGFAMRDAKEASQDSADNTSMIEGARGCHADMPDNKQHPPCNQNMEKEKSVLCDYGIALLYSLPSKAILYISATYGFSPGVSAPSSTSRA